MKTSLNFLFLILIFLSSCSSSEDTQLELTDEIESETVASNIATENTFTMNILDSDDAFLNFEIIELSTGYAVRVQPSNSVQILDSSTFGYPDALQKDNLIEAESAWSTGSNFVLGTSVGNGGLFEGSGLRYLGFRILEDEGFRYAWVLLDNNMGNTSLDIQSYGINQTLGKSILAGQIE